MNKILFFLFCFCITLILSTTNIHAQQAPSLMDHADTAVQEMQKTDLQSAQDFQSTIQRSDLVGGKKIYQD